MPSASGPACCSTLVSWRFQATALTQYLSCQCTTMVCCVDSDQRDASTSRGAENRSEGTGARSTSGQLARSADAPARPGQWRYGPNSKMAASMYTANDCSAAGTAHSTSRCVTLQTAAHSP